MEEKHFGGKIVVPPTQEGGETDVLHRELITKASDLEELYIALREIGSIQGTGKVYFAEELVRKIDEVQKGDRGIDFITRTYGLRDKVKELLGIKEEE